MAEYKVDSDLLASSATTIKGQGEQILTAIGKVKQELAGTEAFWTGAAKSNYVGVMEGWQATATQVEQRLRETMEKLTAAASLYRETEGTNASKFNG